MKTEICKHCHSDYQSHRSSDDSCPGASCTWLETKFELLVPVSIEELKTEMNTEQTPEMQVTGESRNLLTITKLYPLTGSVIETVAILISENAVKDGELFCEAFNVHHETGLTPRQLLDALSEKLVELRSVTEIKNTLIDTVNNDGKIIASLALRINESQKQNKELKEQRDELLKLATRTLTALSGANEFIRNHPSTGNAPQFGETTMEDFEAITEKYSGKQD